MDSKLTAGEGYKETVLGPLPEDWEIVKLGKVANYINGYAFKPQQWKKTGLPIIRIQNLTSSSNKINYFNGELEDKYKVKNGDLLISWSASLGIFKWKGENAWLNQHIFKVCDYSERLWKEFFYYVVMSQIEIMKSKTHGSTMKHITKKEFLNLLIPLPPLPEQKAIAYVLSTIQGAKEKTEKVIQAAKELKKSLMKHLFTYGPVSLDEAKKIKLKETEIGLMPEDWNVVKLGELFNIKQGKQLSGKEKTEGKIKKPFLRTSNVLWGKIDTSNIDEMFFTKEEFDKLKLKFGDILVCEGGDIGRTALYRSELKECAYQNHLHRLRPYNDNINKEFFVFWMNFAINQKQMYSYFANITTIPNLSASRLKNFLIIYPPIPTQQKIASILSDIDQKIESEENKKKALDELFKSMLHNLMTAKIRVNHLDLKV